MNNFIFTGDGKELLEKINNKRLFYVPFKNSYDDWIEAVEAAILKRSEPLNQIAVDLSSGYETGVIFNEISKLNKPFVSFTIMGIEDPNVVFQRVARAPTCAHRVIENTPDDIQRNIKFIRENANMRAYYEEFKNCGNPYLLESGGGELNVARINEEVKKAGRSIRLSGLGDQYMLEDFTGRQKQTTKEMDFLENMLYPILKSAYYINEAYGIELRLPFLDARVVQEYLYLTDELKNRVRKAPMEYLLGLDDVPVMKNAPGFYIDGFRHPITELYL